MMIDRDIQDVAAQLPSSTTVLHCAVRLFLDAARAAGNSETIAIGEQIVDLLQPLNEQPHHC